MSTRSLVLGATAVAAIASAAATAHGQSEGASWAATFGTAGVVRTNFGGEDRAEDVALQADGKIVVAGVGRRDFALARYLPNGRLDRSFGRGGKVRTELGGRDAAAAIAIQRDGRIVAAGESKGDFALVRYLPNGRLDRSFGRRGTVRTVFVGNAEKERFGRVSSRPYSGAKAVAVQRDGRIVVAGWRAFHAGLVRYLPNGRLDRSFGRRGKVVISFGRDYSDASAVAIQRDGKIVAAVNGGPSPDSGGLVRLTRRGTYDRTFGRRGAAFFDVAGVGEGSDVAAVAVQADGKIVAAGGASFIHGPPPSGLPAGGLGLARYLPSGRFDARFGTRGRVMAQFPYASAVAVQADGKIVVAGGGVEVARYTDEGRPDASFGSGGRVRTRVGRRADAAALVIQPEAGIVVAGRANGDFLLVGYRPDGSLDS